MFRKTKVCSGLMLAFGGGIALGALPAMAQQQLERVEITGSAIKRVDAETAVPVTIIKFDDLKKEGVTTIEQVLSRLTGNQSSQGTSQSVGSGTGGAAFADMRGLGPNKTLVLLNGRRLANNAIDGSSPDLNMIPFAALEKVEVLRDGASALYGTDAIGGVINFITKKDFRGGTITLGADKPQHEGGKSKNANIGFGFGDLSKDRFNVFAMADFQKQDPLAASQRPDINNRSLKTSPTTAIGQYNQGGAVQNPSFPTCGSPDGIPLGNGTTSADCGYLYSRKVDLVPTSERASAMIKGTLNITDAHQLGLEYFFSKNTNTTLVAGVPYGALWMNPSSKYYPGAGITPLPTVFTLDPNYHPGTAPTGAADGVIRLRWRDADSGGRREQTENKQQRFVASLEGNLVGWDYKTALMYNENRLTDSLVGGYTDGTMIASGVLNGTLNPFGAQDAAGSAYLKSAAVTGDLFKAKGQVTSVEALISREVGDWLHAGRPAAIAIGTEFRREKFIDKAEVDFATKVVSSTGFDPATDNEGSRNVAAAYTELNVPLLKDLEITASLRHDRYSDFGSTTNPKFSFRYQPAKEFLLRGSYATGFRAPSLYELYAPQTYTNTANNHDDPVRCPGGVPISGAPASDNCDVQFMSLAGGNTALQPEKSKSTTLGIVLSPSADFSASIDFWAIALKHQIAGLDDNTIFNNPTKYASLFHRAPDGSLATDGSLCPGANCGYVEAINMNLGGVRTRGLDFDANYRVRGGDAGIFTFGFNGTYVIQYAYQNEENGAWIQNAGSYEGPTPVIFRWSQTVNVNWTRGQWSLGLANHYKTGYVDQNANGEGNYVDAYQTTDVYGTWQPLKGLSLTLGVRNIADAAPPLSNQAATFQVGYDPRYADATGRTYYLRGTYSF